MNRVVTCTAVALLLSSLHAPLASEKPLALPGLVDQATGSLALQLDAEAWQDLFRAGAARVSRFPLPNGQAVDLDVSSFDLTGTSTRFFLAQAGDLKEIAGPSMRFFRGRVSGDPGSLVSLNLFDGRIAGFIRTGGAEYTFGPRAFAVGAEGWNDIQVRDDALEKADPRCDGEEEPIKDLDRSAPALPGAEAIDSSTLLVGKVAVEGTVEWVTKMGGVAAAQTYTLNVMSQVSAIYETDVRVQIQVPYVLMNAAEPDGYSGSSNSTATMLGEMRTKWNGSDSLRSVFRSSVHLFGTYPSGGSGRAYIDVLCSNVPAGTNAYDYGVSLMDGNGGSWERRMVAHEIGHNFSSPHSHCYSPELDECSNTETGCYAGTVVQTTGTIMSYCSTRLSTFHQRERDERIRPGAERAYPSCMAVAGNPGTAGDMVVMPAPTCPAADPLNDDGASNGMYGFSGTMKAAWIKRFTPTCHPFKVTGLDVRISHTSVSPGRALRLLVYVDPSGSGTPANATLVRTEDTTVQVVGSSAWNRYTLASPVLVASGDYYIGFEDLVTDSTTTYIMDYDTRTANDSFYQPDSLDPSTFGPFPNGAGSWMIRGHGGAVAAGSVTLSWDPACNDAAVPDQDFAVYQGMVGDWSGYVSLTCSTGRARSWLVENPPSGAYWIIVPQTSVAEGSYGQASSGERRPAAAACRPQAIGACQ